MSTPTRETQLAPGFVARHGHGIGEIHAATVGAHGYAQAMLGGHRSQYFRIQAPGLGAENQRVAALIGDVGMAAFGAG